MVGFTKGPWVVYPPQHGYENVSEEGGLGGIYAGDECVCSFGSDDTYYNSCGEYPSPENAQLIAAAPDMHDTLTFILTCDQEQLMSEGMDRVRAVLKLADGR